MTRVVIVATPASGRDIHRLVAGASVYGNAEKGADGPPAADRVELQVCR
jgi:hypothetical protein